MWRPRRVDQVQACWEYMEEAYMRASGNNSLPAGARQVYYAIRDNVYGKTGKSLNAGYFSYKVLPDYLKETGKD
jgi:hypothetical protein